MKKITSFIKAKRYWALIIFGIYLAMCGVYDFIKTGGSSSHLLLDVYNIHNPDGYLHISNTMVAFVIGIILALIGIYRMKQK